MSVVERIANCHTESNEAADRRWAAVRTIDTAFKEWTKDASSQVVVYGSVALEVHLEGADTDLVCVTSSGFSHNFFRAFPSYLRGKPNVTSVSYVPAMPPLLNAVVHGVQHDILFCFIPLGAPLPPNVNLNDDRYLYNMDEPSRRSVGGPRLVGALFERVPNMVTFKPALKAVKLWAARRGLHGVRYGYPGGVTWAAMMCFTARRCPANASPDTLVSTFFKLFEGQGLNHPISILDDLHGWQKGPTDEMAVLVPFPTPPGTPVQMINTCSGSVCTLTSFRAEIDRAAFLCKVPGRMEGVWNRADFFSSFPRFLVVETRTTSVELLDPWLGFVSSRIRELLALLDQWAKDRKDCILWPYPFMFRTDCPTARLGSGVDYAPGLEGDYGGYFFVGLRTEFNESAGIAVYESEDLVRCTEAFVTLCAEWGGKREGMFQPVVSVMEPRQVPSFVLDNPIAVKGGVKERSIADIIRNFKHSGMDAVDGAVLMKVKEDAKLYWMPGEEESDAILKGCIVVVKAVDGEEDMAWVRTEEGEEGFMKLAMLQDYAMATIKERDAETPGSPLTPSTTFMTTKGETRLRAFPLMTSCDWVEDGIIPEGAVVAVRALDEQGEFAFVRFNKVEGFITTKHLKVDAQDGHWVKCTRVKELKEILNLAKETHMAHRVGPLTTLEQSVLSSHAGERGLTIEKFSDSYFCYEPQGMLQFPLSPPMQYDREVLFSGVRLGADSISALKEYFEDKGMIPQSWDIRCENVFLKAGPLNDLHTEGQEVQVKVVATGSNPTCIAAGVVGCSRYTVSPTPHVIVAVNPNADVKRSANVSRVSWSFIDPAEVLDLSGVVTQFFDDDEYDLTPEMTFDDTTDPYTCESRLSFG